jgi:hypothetical protein
LLLKDSRRRIKVFVYVLNEKGKPLMPRKTLYFDLRKLDGLKIHFSAKAKDCKLLETSKTFLTQKRSSISSTCLKTGIFMLSI